MFVNSYQARKLAALGLCTVLFSATPVAAAYADSESPDSAPASAPTAPAASEDSGTPAAPAEPATNAGNPESPDANPAGEGNDPAGTPATGNTEVNEENQPTAEETQPAAPEKDPNIPETIDIQGTPYTPTFTTLPKGSMSDFPDPYAKKNAPKTADGYPNRYFIHYIDVFTGESLSLDPEWVESKHFSDAWNSETKTQFVAYEKTFDGKLPKYIQRYRPKGYYQLNVPDFSKAIPGGDPLDVYIFCAPLKSFVVDYIEESDPDHPLVRIELSGANAWQEFQTDPGVHPNEHVLPTQFELEALYIPGFTVAPGSENGVKGAFTVVQKSPEDTAPIRKTIVYKKIEGNRDGVNIMASVIKNGPVLYNKPSGGFPFGGETWGTTANIKDLAGEILKNLKAKGWTIFGFYNGPEFTFGLDSPNVIEIYRAKNRPVYVHSYVAEYRYGKLVPIKEIKATEALGTPNSDFKIPNGEWNVDLAARENLAVEGSDGTTVNYKLASHIGETSGVFNTFGNNVYLLYTEVPTYKDAETQTPPATGEEKETQTENPTTAENGSQTDNPSTAEAGSQTEKPSTSDGEVQTDPTSSTSTGVQTDNPSTVDTGVQAQPDPEPQPEPAPNPEPTPEPTPAPEPVAPKKVDEAVQTEPVKPASGPKHAQAEALPKTGDAQGLAGLGVFAGLVSAAALSASRRFKKN